MIKKLLLLILVCVLAFGVFSSWAHGVSINILGLKFNTSSYAGIVTKAQELNNKIKELETVNTTTYNTEVNKKNAAVNNFEKSKAEYEKLATQASIEEIREANKREEYYLDYLWMKIGTYANNSDIKVLIDPDYDAALINFDVSGQYIAVINFIYDLENDSELAFNIDNLVMQGGSTAAVTKASFQVRNVNIITSEVQAD